MKKAILIHGWNKEYGKFLIYTSDANNIEKNLRNATVSIVYNNTSRLTFTIFPNNDTFSKLLPIKTDIVLTEVTAGAEKQLFVGFVLNVKSFSDKGMNIGKEINCISSHAFFNYRPLNNDKLSKSTTTNNKDKIFTLTGDNPDIAIKSILEACRLNIDVDRYQYLPEKNFFNNSNWTRFNQTYQQDKTLANGISDILRFYNLDLCFKYDLSKNNLDIAHRHGFFLNLNIDNKKIPRFEYSEYAYNYEDEIDFTTFANIIFLSNNNNEQFSLTYAKDSTQEYGSFRINRTCDAQSLETLNSECKRQVILACEPKRSISVDFIDPDNKVQIGKELKIINKAFGVEAIFLVQKIEFNVITPFNKKIEMKNKKFNYIEELAKRHRR